MKRKQFYELASNNSGKQIEKATINKFELAEEKDYMDITYILASSTPNLNGALFTKEELELSKETILNTPLIIIPSWEDGSPTGHSIQDFPRLDWDARVVGTHVKSDLIEENGIAHLQVVSRFWTIRYPEIASVIKSLHEVGDLKFSMEASYQSQTIEGTVRTLHNVRFVGSAIVSDPANPWSYSLEVANKNKRKTKEEKVVTFEQAMQILKEHNADAYVLITNEVANLNKTAKDLQGVEGTNKELASSLQTANETIDGLKIKVTGFEQAAQEAKEKELASTRLTEMAQYVAYTEEEKATKMATFASMSEEVYSLVLETAKRNKPEAHTEVAGISSDTSLKISKGLLDGIENLD